MEEEEEEAFACKALQGFHGRRRRRRRRRGLCM
jgi:hypothetical protein